MRHLTWAVAWFVVGLVVTLGTASVLQQVATARPVPVPTEIAPAPGPAPVTKPPAEGRELMASATRRLNRYER